MTHSRATAALLLLTLGTLLHCGIDVVQAEDDAPKVFIAHQKLVRWIGYSPDGKALASASFDGTLQIRDAENGVLRTTLTGHRGQVYWGSFSNDGRMLASGGDDAVVRLWDLRTGQLQKELPGHQASAWTGKITPDGTRIISGGPDAMVFVWNIATGKAERSFKHTAPVWWIDVAPDSKSAAVAGGDGKVTLYDPNTGKVQRTFGNHAGGVYCVAYSHDGSLIATAGADSCSKIWNASSGVLKWKLPQFGPVYSLAFSPDARLLATCGSDYSVRFWNVGNGSFRDKRTGHKDAVWTIAFDPSGSRCAGAGGDGRILVADVTLPLILITARPKKVDLRPDFEKYGLAVVAQGSRNTCSVHTFTRAMEFAVSKQENRGIRLSDEYLNWATNQVIGNVGPQAADRGQFFEHLWMGYSKHGICTAETMPFQTKFDPGTKPSQLALKSVEELKKHAFLWRDITGPKVKNADVITEAKRILLNGWPLLAGSTHSLLVVGYVDQPRGGYFIVADSGTGTFIDKPTKDKLHTAIPFTRVSDYGFSWIECVPANTRP